MATDDTEKLDGCAIDFTDGTQTTDDELDAVAERYAADLRALADG